MTKPTKTETVTIQEINFDAWETDNLLVSGTEETPLPITVDTNTPLTAFGTDVITVTNEDLAKITQGSNGINQGDLFNGWPEDGPPITITTLKEEK